MPFVSHTEESKRLVRLGLIRYHSKLSDEIYELLYNNPELKWCPACRSCLLRDNFYPSRAKSDGYSQYCKPCFQAVNREQRKTDKYKVANRIRHKKYIYGISKEEYLHLIESNPVCQICKKLFDENRRPCIDHNHSTKKVRGVLCDTCNRGIGYLKEDSTILQNAIRYLERNI